MSRPDIWQDYDPKTALPLGGYLVLVLSFATLTVAAFIVLRRRGLLDNGSGRGTSGPLPRVSWPDFTLLAVATHQLSWMIGRDRVLSPLRALFARYESSGGVGELNDVPRGGGLLHALGDLVTCPYCLGPWVAVALLFAFFMWPRGARLGFLALTLVAASNALHQLYTIMKHAAG